LEIDPSASAGRRFLHAGKDVVSNFLRRDGLSMSFQPAWPGRVGRMQIPARLPQGSCSRLKVQCHQVFKEVARTFLPRRQRRCSYQPRPRPGTIGRPCIRSGPTARLMMPVKSAPGRGELTSRLWRLLDDTLAVRPGASAPGWYDGRPWRQKRANPGGIEL